MPRKTSTEHAADVARYRKKQKEAGNCPWCGKPVLEGRAKCAECLETNRRQGREKYQRLRAEGKCYRCGKGRDGLTCYCSACALKIKQNRDALKLLVFNQYGGAMCSCCGEVEFDFLTMDHVNGGGAKHRRANNGQSIYQILRREGFPSGFRVQCYNCNCSRAHSSDGLCPHERERKLS